jgi:hypothetical protein
VQVALLRHGECREDWWVPCLSPAYSRTFPSGDRQLTTGHSTAVRENWRLRPPMTAEPVNYDWPPVHVSLASDDSRDMARLTATGFAVLLWRAVRSRTGHPRSVPDQLVDPAQPPAARVGVRGADGRPTGRADDLTDPARARPPQGRRPRQALRRRGDRPARRAGAVSDGQVDAGGRRRVDDGVRRHRAHHARGGSGDRTTLVVRNGDQGWRRSPGTSRSSRPGPINLCLTVQATT